MMLQTLTDSVLLGLGASLILDGWALGRRSIAGVPMLDYGWLTRWLAGLPAGRLRLEPGQTAPLTASERAPGWALHYAIGVLYAGVFLLIVGPGWMDQPSVLPALVFGIVTILAPFLILQPALGRGVFASRTPAPWTARLQTLLNHGVFGVGLYATALALMIVRS